MPQPVLWVMATIPSTFGYWSRISRGKRSAMNLETLAEQFTVESTPMKLRVANLAVGADIAVERGPLGFRHHLDVAHVGPDRIVALEVAHGTVLDVDVLAGRDVRPSRSR